MHMPPVFFSRRAIILDCGASRTALGVFSRNGNRLRLDRFAAKPFRLQSGTEDNWLEDTGAAFRSLGDGMGLRGPVVLILPAHLTLTKLIKTPRVAPAEREKIIRFEAGQHIPYALADVAWDSVVAGGNGAEMEVSLAAAKLEVVEALCAAAEAAGFEPAVVLPSSIGALAAFRLLQATPVAGSLVLHLGTHSATVLRIEPGRFALRTFSLGSNGVALTVEKGQESDARKAGAVRPAGRGENQKGDAPEAVKTRLLQEITRSVLHFRAQGCWEGIKRVYLFEEGTRLPGFADQLAAKLKVPIDRLDPSGAIEITDEAARSSAAGSASALVDLVGAAATQLRPNQTVLNLLPLRRRQLIDLRQRQPWLIAAAVLAVTAVLPLLAHFRRVAAEAEKKTAAIERALVPVRQSDLRNRAYLQRLGRLREQIAGFEDISARRSSWLALLADLQERLERVEDTWIESLQVAPLMKGGPLKLAISGRMLDRTNPLSRASPETFSRVKTLLASLADSPFVAAVEAERFDNSQPGILKFDCVLVAGPDRPL